MTTPDVLPPIHCARCDQPVKTVEWWREDWDGDLIIEAHCHGEQETATVPAGQEPPAVMFKARVPEEDCAG